MTTKTWDGSDGHWRDSNHWIPAGVPQNGDSVVIREGTVHGTLLNLSSNPIDIGSDHPVSDPQLDLNTAVLGDVSVFDESARTGPYHTRYADISVSGGVAENGHLAIGNLAPEGVGIPGDLDLTIADYSVFALTGSALEQASSSFVASGASHSAFANFGSFTDIGGKADFAVPVIGSGSFTVERSKFPSGTLTFEGSVSAGQAVNVNEGGSLALDQPLRFSARSRNGLGRRCC
ncbi:MAG: hypothetical protein JOZ42_10565 [Acetobacteraceae bacterium]|nr:hypothetical protein [Acetobacteraceae bacterium]